MTHETPEQRKDRLAEALRANLRRRKVQTRQRGKSGTDQHSEPGREDGKED